MDFRIWTVNEIVVHHALTHTIVIAIGIVFPHVEIAGIGIVEIQSISFRGAKERYVQIPSNSTVMVVGYVEVVTFAIQWRIGLLDFGKRLTEFPKSIEMLSDV